VGVFEELHADRVTGSLAMFDRMIFKGRLTGLYKKDGARYFLWTQGVALTDFTGYAKATTERIANNARKLVTDAGRPVISFDHVKTRHFAQRKDELAKSIAERDGITEGIICLISAVETCISFQVRRSHTTHTINLYRRERKCLHHYLYLIDPEFGFMHVRIQGWMPYDCQIYLNGREWLARQLDRRHLGYRRYDNALVRIDNLQVACQLCERFAHRAWVRVLNVFARLLNPILPAVRAAGCGGYYWVLDQAEIATDVMFTTRPKLLEIWPDLVRHAALNMSSQDVLGFLGPSCTPRWPPKWSPTPNADPKAGLSGIGWPATGSRSTTRLPSCGWRPSSTIRVSSGSCASSPTPRASANDGGVPCAKASATCGAASRSASAPTSATWPP
jgi:hypothetical protein